MSTTTRMSPGEPSVRLVRISWTSAALGVGAIIGFVALRGAFVGAHRVLGWAVASLAVSVLVDPVVEWLGKVVPRVAAVLLTFLVMAGVAGGLIFGTVDDLDSEVARLQQIAPGAIENLERSEGEFGRFVREIDLSARTETFLEALDQRVGSGSGALAQNAPTAPVYFVCAILSIFLLVYGPAIATGGINRIADQRRREVVLELLVDALHRSRRTIGVLAAQGSVVGLGAWATASVLDLPAPVVLGLVAGMAALLPDFGIVLGLLPLAALTAAFESTNWASVVVVVAVAVQGIEAVVIRPRVSGFGVDIGPALVWVVALLGYTIYGVGAAVYGVIYAIFAMAIVDGVPAARQALEPDEPDEATVSA